jgi:hypothetical protein
MKNINKGFVKADKYEAIQDETGNWVPVGEVVETAEKQNALTYSILQRINAQNQHKSGFFLGKANTASSSAVGGDLTAPGDFGLMIFLCEFPVSTPGGFPGSKTSDTFTSNVYGPRQDGGGLYKGSFRSLDYDDRDSDESKTVLVFKHRFDPDVTRTRTIRSIGIAHVTSLSLGAPLTQSPTQIIDVTYTIEIDLSDLKEPIFTRSEKDVRKHLSFPITNTYSGFVPERTVLLPQSKLIKGVLIGIPEDMIGDQTYYPLGSARLPEHRQNTVFTNDAYKDPERYLNNFVNLIDGVYDLQLPTIAYNVPTENAGMLIGTAVAGSLSTRRKNIHDWHSSKGSISRANTSPGVFAFQRQESVNDSATGSAVQNVFPRTSANTLPYQDVDALATGTGTFRISDSDAVGSSWTANEDGLAKKYRINITTGGASGVSEYNIERRNWGGTAGNLHYPRVIPMLYANFQTTDANDSDGFGSTIMPFAGDEKYNYHGQNPARCATALSGSLNDNIVTGSVMYKYPEFITYDKTGFTVMHMNQPGQNFDANFSQICQLVVKQNTAKDIYVADISSGLWKVTRTLGQSESEATVTRLTASNAADDTVCRGVQIKNDGTIWAIFGQEMCSSADDGSSWTVYNASSATQFKLDTVVDTTNPASAPERIAGFTMDRYNTEDRFAIPVRNATKLGHEDTDTTFYWWSRAGSAGGTSDAASSTASGAYPNYNLRAGNDTIWCSKGGLFHFAGYTASSPMRCAVFGQTQHNQGYAWSSTGKTPLYGNKSHWWQDADGEEYVLGATNSEPEGVRFCAVKSDRFGPADCTSSYSFFDGTSSIPSDQRHVHKYMNDGLNTHVSTLSGTTQQNVFNIQGLVDPGTALFTSGTNYTRQYVAYSLTGSSSDSAGSPNIGDWTQYGWDGSSWVEGSTASKATHTSRDSIIDGLSVKFDGGDAASFVDTEFYDAYLFNGVLKDDASTFSTNLKQSYLDVDTTTDFETAVPSFVSGVVTEPVYLSTIQSQYPQPHSKTIWAEQGRWALININNSSYPLNLRSEQAMQGDFSIVFKLSEINMYATGNHGVKIGLTQVHPDIENTYNLTPHADWMFLGYGGRPNATDSAGNLAFDFKSGTSTLERSVALTDYDPSDEFKIERSNGNVEWFRNNVSIHTSALLGDNTKVNFWVQTDQSGMGTVILDDLTATYIDSDGPRVTVGNGTSTGASSVDFRKVVENSTFSDDYNEIFIDGVPATINYNPLSLPAAGECTLLAHSGRLKFDASDAGATITGKVGYLKKF